MAAGRGRIYWHLKNFSALLSSDLLLGKSRSFNKFSCAKRPVQREFDVTNRLRAARYNL
jgi:hypothetical protein